MAAGRPRIADPKVLYRLASHLYWELKTVDEPKHKTVDEGLSRIWVDRKKRARLFWEARKAAKLTNNELNELVQGVDERIRMGFLPESERETCIRELTKDTEYERRFTELNAARKKSQKLIPIPGEPEIIDALLSAITPDEVREICADAFPSEAEEVKSPLGPLKVIRPNWPISSMGLLPGYLAQYAPQFIEAKRDRRFPKSGRPTSRFKQLWFLSRALAGAVHGISTRTAVNIIGAIRPDEQQDMARLTKRKRAVKVKKRKK